MRRRRVVRVLHDGRRAATTDFKIRSAGCGVPLLRLRQSFASKEANEQSVASTDLHPSKCFHGLSKISRMDGWDVCSSYVPVEI